MNFIVFDGVLGSGKTLGAVVFANYIKNKNDDIKLYSNFGMYNALPFDNLTDFLEIAQNPSSIIVLDEAHIDLDSRSFSTNHVKFLTQTSFYLRKIRCTLIMTSPLFENLDSRIRAITNMLVLVSNDKKYFYYDMIDIQSNKYLKTKKIKKETAFAMNLYDTNAIVSPLEMPQKKEEFELFLSDLKRETQNYYVTDSRSDARNSVAGAEV